MPNESCFLVVGIDRSNLCLCSLSIHWVSESSSWGRDTTQQLYWLLKSMLSFVRAITITLAWRHGRIDFSQLLFSVHLCSTNERTWLPWFLLGFWWDAVSMVWLEASASVLEIPLFAYLHLLLLSANLLCGNSCRQNDLPSSLFNIFLALRAHLYIRGMVDRRPVLFYRVYQCRIESVSSVSGEHTLPRQGYLQSWGHAPLRQCLLATDNDSLLTPASLQN